MSATQKPADGAIVTIAHVGKSFGTVKALGDVSLSVAGGAVLWVVGPAGAGKSTLLHCIHRRETIDRGTIRVDGAMIARGRTGGGASETADVETVRLHSVTGMVPQPPDLPDHMTALQAVIEEPLTLLKRPRREVVAEAMALLKRVGLADRRDAYPSELTGGQRQRIAIARALALKPKLMLFDEPAAGLDAEEARAVLAVMRELAAEGMTMIVAAREPGFLCGLADTVAFMERGEIVGLAGPAGLT